MCESCTTAASAVVLQQKDFTMTFFFFFKSIENILYVQLEHSSYGVFVCLFVLEVNGGVAFFASA